MAFTFQYVNSNFPIFNDSKFVKNLTENIITSNIIIMYQTIPLFFFVLYKSFKFDFFYCFILFLVLLTIMIINSYLFFKQKNFHRFVKLFLNANNLDKVQIGLINFIVTFSLWIGSLAFYLNYGI